MGTTGKQQMGEKELSPTLPSREEELPRAVARSLKL